jgi:hypothetical protein
MYALLSKELVEESKRYQYLKTEVKQSNANGILPNSLLNFTRKQSAFFQTESRCIIIVSNAQN